MRNLQLRVNTAYVNNSDVANIFRRIRDMWILKTSTILRVTQKIMSKFVTWFFFWLWKSENLKKNLTDFLVTIMALKIEFYLWLDNITNEMWTGHSP